MWRSTIRLTVPGTLEHRDIAVRVVAETCRLVTAGPAVRANGEPTDLGYDLRHPFDAAFVSAFAEIFNNIALHAYGGKGGGTVEIVLEASATGLVLDAVDHGATFDIDAVPAPELDKLPESGMGIHIARTMLDEVEYQAGPPNKWHLAKRFEQPAAAATGGD
jgi:hypothetical protein